MTFTYIRSEPQLWTVGFHKPDGSWEPESDHGSPDEAARRTAWLNGGDAPETDDEQEERQPETFDQWCIVELLGHRRLAGRVREVQVAGHGFLRLDVPDAQTQYVAPGSVYALHPVTEQVARAVAARCRPEPVQRWELPASVTAQPGHGDHEDLDQGDLDDEGPF